MVREGCLLTVQFPNSRSEADTLVIEGEDLWELVSLAGETKDFRVLIGGPPVPMPHFRDPGDWYDWEQCGVVAASEEPIRDGQYGMRVTTLPQPKE